MDEIETDGNAYDPLAPLNQADPYAGRDRTLTPYDPTGRRQTGWGPGEGQTMMEAQSGTSLLEDLQELQQVIARVLSHL